MVLYWTLCYTKHKPRDPIMATRKSKAVHGWRLYDEYVDLGTLIAELCPGKPEQWLIPLRRMMLFEHLKVP